MVLEQLARQIFAELHQTILSHEELAARGGVEAVHDMRVATRRLRVALGNFSVCCDRDARRAMNARIQHLADALGGVRDLDLMMLALRGQIHARPPADQPFLVAFIRRMRDRRRRRLRRLQAFLNGAEYALFKRDFLSTLRPAPEIAVADQPPLESTASHGQSF